MKPYFAKYLPKPNGYNRVIKDHGIPVDYEYEVHLCLCCRDIEIGESFYNQKKPHESFIADNIEMGSGENYFPNEMLIWHKEGHTSYWFKLSECFKVIGKISEEATWVTDVMEFDEKEIKWLSDAGNDEQISIADLRKYAEDDEVPFTFPTGSYAIKGPCGHFH